MPPSQAWSVFVSTLIAVLVVALALAMWSARAALLMAFASAVGATMLLALARPLERFTGIGRAWAVSLAMLLVLGLAAGLGMSMGRETQRQLSDIAQRIPTSAGEIERRVRDFVGLPKPAAAPAAGGAGAAASVPGDLVQMVPSVVTGLASFGNMLLEAIAGFVIVVAGAFYLALDPDRYRHGMLHLIPKSRRAEVEDALCAVGAALERWVKAQLLGMALVGAMFGLGAWALGLPSPLALGLFAGLAEIVPVVGPFVGALPAVLVAASVSMEMLVWTLLLFVVVQQVESNVITPLVQEKMTAVPAFVLLFAIVALGLILGLAGVLVAAPLTVALVVLVRKLYVEEALDDYTAAPEAEAQAALGAANAGSKGG